MKKLSVILLILFTLLAVVFNFLPHLNYPYALHVDEWVHWQFANHLSSVSPLYFGGQSTSLEAGFHYLLATLSIIGIPYAFMFTFFASIFTIFLCLSVFILTRRIWNESAGVFSILFIILLKSSVAVLGPVLLVPMSLGLIFIAAGLFLVKIKSNLWFLLLAALLIIHPPSALAFFLLINIEFFIIRRKNLMKNILLQVLAGIISLPFYLDIFLTRGTSTINSLAFTPIVSALFIPSFLGWFIVALVLIGIYFYSEKRDYSLFLYSLALLVFIYIFYQYKIEVFIPYARALMYLFVIFAVAFGIGFSSLVSLGKSKKVIIVISLVLLACVILSSLPSKLDSNNYYYHLIDSKDYAAFSWIKENTSKDSIAVLDVWKANAFTPIAEREVYSRIVQGPSNISEAKNQEVLAFFASNCTNTSFLEQNNISIIYWACLNPSLKEVYPNVWVLK